MAKIATPAELAAMSPRQLLRYIERLTKASDHGRAAVDARVLAFREGKSRSPAVLVKSMAAAAGISDGGVINAVRKLDEQQGLR